MNVGIDIGYSAVKAVSGVRRVTFPSVVGTPDKARFSLAGGDTIILTGPRHVQVGAGAVSQSRFVNRREDRAWIESNEYADLAIAAWTELSSATRVDLRVVTGLPVAFFDDRAAVRDRLLGEHNVQREGRHAQSLRVTDCHVIPQPFGALLAEALDNHGHIINHDLATGNVGVIDAGGKTTNLLSVHKLAEISRESASVNVGAWDVIRAVRDWLAVQYPGLEDLRPHQVTQAVVDRRLRYYGETVDLSSVIDEMLEPFADQVLAEATQLWNGAATLDAILVAGGGALLLARSIQAHFPHALVVEDPIFANALGYWRFAQRIARG